MKKATEATPNIQLQQARKRRNMRQEDVAAVIGTTPVNVSRWEKGVTFPSFRFRHELCKFFSMSMEELGLLTYGTQDIKSSTINDDAEIKTKETATQENNYSPLLEVKSISQKSINSNSILPNPQIFLGRENLIKRIFSALVSRNNISISGLPRIGKTYVLKRLSSPKEQHQFELETGQELGRCIFVYINLEAFLQKSFDGFFETLSRYVIQQGQEKMELTYHSELGADSFTDILDQINKQAFYPVLLMDMFDEIVKNEQIYSILGFLRAHATMGRISYVTSSIALLYDICQNNIAGSPFFNIFYPYRLEEFSDAEALDFMGKLAESSGLIFNQEEKLWVRKEAGLHPFFIQRVCNVLLEEGQQSFSGDIDLLKIRKLAYRDLLPHFTDIWQRLTETQRASLRDEGQQKNHQSRNLPELSESAFFRQFVRNTFEIGLFQMSIHELEEALNKINDLAALGETNLRLMKAVTQRLNPDILPTSVEKGKVIRDILKESLERLSGSGVRTDFAPDWQYYNILYYRYFRHHLKNNMIAARLGYTSDRWYYRNRSKAIEALRNALFEME
jgi:transcriptional regulator with XRE-family HTH domain